METLMMCEFFLNRVTENNNTKWAQIIWKS